MRRLSCILVGLLMCGQAMGGAKPVRRASTEHKSYDAADSAGLFVGIREFENDNDLMKVAYAVDDAVDLAYELALVDHLVPPKRVILALSGEPQKEESRRRLQSLLDGGAKRHTARQTDILTLLESQAKIVANAGVLFVSFATHGVTEDGTQYLLTQSSLLDHLETAVTEEAVTDTIAKKGVDRAVIFVDACRKRLTRDRRNGDNDPRSRAAFILAMDKVYGQALLSAAAAGDYAYDDDVRKNGVFTGAVIDGLHCAAAANTDGFITVYTLSSYVGDRVLAWVQANKNADAKKATQMHCDLQARDMPLAICH